MSSKQTKKGRNTPFNTVQHHPWDEVSLPGTGPEIEDQSSHLLLNGSTLELCRVPKINVNSTEDECSVEPKPSQTNVLESYLIENVTAGEVPCETSISIEELLPAESELSSATSKLHAVGDVSEVVGVEPAGLKARQAIETSIPTIQVAEVGADLPEQSTTPSRETAIRVVAEILVDDIAQQVVERLACTPPAGALNESSNDKTDCGSARSWTPLPQTPTGILKCTEPGAKTYTESALKTASNELKIVEVPTPDSPLEAEERNKFLDSLPQYEHKSDLQLEQSVEKRLSAECKREYYQSLKKYLLDSCHDKPPVPLQTYRWEDLRRAKERGGYPWTHLYKRPLGPGEEPEIVLLLRKSQELRFTSESPKSFKRVRYDEQVLVKETERYIEELSDEEDSSAIEHEYREQLSDNVKPQEDSSSQIECISCVSDSVLALGRPRPVKVSRLAKIRDIIRRRRSGRTQDDAQSLPGNSAHNSAHDLAAACAPSVEKVNREDSATTKTKEHVPVMKKIKLLADRQKRRFGGIKRIALRKDEKIVLGEETKILKLKNSPKSGRDEIPHFIEKQDSDEILEIVELDESPSRKRNKEASDTEEQAAPATSSSNSILQPDEIIELPSKECESEPVNFDEASQEPVVTIEITEAKEPSAPPKKAPRLRREHVYEDIGESPSITSEQLHDMLALSSAETLRESLLRQDNSMFSDIDAANKPLPLDRMGSSEEDPIASAATDGSRLAPISSIDSVSSDEDRSRSTQLSPVSEESDAAEIDEQVMAPIVTEVEKVFELKPAIKKEPSPAPSDKKVTFSHLEDEPEPEPEAEPKQETEPEIDLYFDEPHREDIELPSDVLRAAADRHDQQKNSSDHDYEPIGTTTASASTPLPPTSTLLSLEGSTTRNKEPSPAPTFNAQFHDDSVRPASQATLIDPTALARTPLSSGTITPRPDSRLEEEAADTFVYQSTTTSIMPEKSGASKKSFMASAQSHTRRMQDGLRHQAGKLRMKMRAQPKKSGSPKAKERRRFKAPEFAKMKLPEIKIKELKRPEFTKFNKPEMPKFKLPERLSTMKLKRTKSLKEYNEDAAGGSNEEHVSPPTSQEPQKKFFDFNFGTYPRAFRKKKPAEPPIELIADSSLGTTGASFMPSTGTQPSSVVTVDTPEGDRGPGPVRSRWADKFIDVPFNDSEGSHSRRYGSELSSFDRDLSLDLQLKDALGDSGSEQRDASILGVVAEGKEFAEYDEENRAIHEISKQRADEFKRRPFVHQDSDLRSEDSKDIVGWTERDAQKNKMLRSGERAATIAYSTSANLSPRETWLDPHSNASSSRKVVVEELGDDEFFLRKRGISEDNNELRHYISNSIRRDIAAGDIADFDELPPPPKPHRTHKAYRRMFTDDSLEFPRSDYGDDFSAASHNGSEFLSTPKRPMRKGRSKYSVNNSQDIPMVDDEGASGGIPYFEDDEEYLRPPTREQNGQNGHSRAGQSFGEHDRYSMGRVTLEEDALRTRERPEPPRRQKRHERARQSASMEKDAFINGFGGRSISNTHLQPEDVIVYRTEHEYHVPLATPETIYTDGASTPSRKSRSASHFEETKDQERGSESQRDGYADQIREDAKHEKFIIDMLENDGYAVVRKEVPKPTPPMRRKKNAKLPEDRFATLPSMRTKRAISPTPSVSASATAQIPASMPTPVPARPPPPQEYAPSMEPIKVPRRRSVVSLDARQNYEQRQATQEDDYEEPSALAMRPESPRNLQSGAVISKMKGRPLPAPPRPPREKRQRDRNDRRSEETTSEYFATSSTADSSYDQEIEVATQTDPLPADFVCEDFEITEDMKVIEPRRTIGGKTLDDLLRAIHDNEDEDKAAEGASLAASEERRRSDEQLSRSLQRFRDANQRSFSERSRASSLIDHRSKSTSRAQTPSAIILERRVATPKPGQGDLETLSASLTVRPIDALSYSDEELRREEEELRREGLLSDGSQYSKSDVELGEEDEVEPEQQQLLTSDYAASSADLELEADPMLETEEHTASELDSKLDTEDEERLLEEDTDYAERYSTIEEEEIDEEDEDKDHAQREKFTKSVEKVDGRLSPETERLRRELLQSLGIGGAEGTATTAEQLTEDDNEVCAIFEHKGAEATPIVAESVSPLGISEAASVPEQEPEPEQPLPPPRKKSTVADLASLAVAETEAVALQLPNRIDSLEVARLRVHALQAGQIMVSQLHGKEIGAEALQCQSGNLVVDNISLPPRLIEDIVRQVRNSEQRALLLTTETQTSRQPSRESSSKGEGNDTPPKQSAQASSSNLDEQTQTDVSQAAAGAPPPPGYPSIEYLQSLAPLALYNLQCIADAESDSARRSVQAGSRKRQLRRRTREIYELDNDDFDEAPNSELEIDGSQSAVERSGVSRRSRTRTRSITLTPSALDGTPPTVTEAGREFIAACTMQLINAINRLTNCVRQAPQTDARLNGAALGSNERNVKLLIAMLIFITILLFAYLVASRQVHTHHWDYFNPPGNAVGRLT